MDLMRVFLMVKNFVKTLKMDLDFEPKEFKLRKETKVIAEVVMRSIMKD